MLPSRQKILAALVPVLFVLGCGEPSGTVYIDISRLAAQASALGKPVNQVRVIARPDTFVPTEENTHEIIIPISELAFELDLAAGRWLFEAVGEWTTTDPPAAVYFGDLHVELLPLSEIDLTIPMFPAGEIRVEVTAVGDFELPDDALIRFVPLSPRPDQSSFYAAPFAEGVLTRVLPTGEYSAQGEITFDGTNYSAAGEDYSVYIEHGQLSYFGLIIE